VSAPRLRVATRNAGKRDELFRLVRAALHPAADLELLGLEDLRDLEMPPEDARSYADNARGKAEAVAARDPGAAVLADDSGIEVEALGGAPGLRSARWATAPDGALLDGAGLNAALLACLGDLPEARRGARMVCAVALLLPGRPAAAGAGEVAGFVAREARGAGGFGYDALFLLPDGRRFSLVPPADKDACSHRARAVAAAAPALRAWFLSGTSR
jgi:XTP/dITP diphosphohydrolase